MALHTVASAAKQADLGPKRKISRSYWTDRTSCRDFCGQSRARLLLGFEVLGECHGHQQREY
jgi:hypothetical protein